VRVTEEVELCCVRSVDFASQEGGLGAAAWGSIEGVEEVRRWSCVCYGGGGAVLCKECEFCIARRWVGCGSMGCVRQHGEHVRGKRRLGGRVLHVSSVGLYISKNGVVHYECKPAIKLREICREAEGS